MEAPGQLPSLPSPKSGAEGHHVIADTQNCWKAVSTFILHCNSAFKVVNLPGFFASPWLVKGDSSLK